MQWVESYYEDASAFSRDFFEIPTYLLYLLMTAWRLKKYLVKAQLPVYECFFRNYLITLCPGYSCTYSLLLIVCTQNTLTLAKVQ